MKIFRQFLACLLVAGMVVPTFSCPMARVHESGRQFASDVIDLMKLPFTASDNPEIQAINQVSIHSNAHARAHAEMDARLRAELHTFNECAVGADLIRQAIGTLEKVQKAFDQQQNITIDTALQRQAVPIGLYPQVRELIAEVAPFINNVGLARVAATQHATVAQRRQALLAVHTALGQVILTPAANGQHIRAASTALEVHYAQVEMQMNLYYRLYKCYGFTTLDMHNNRPAFPGANVINPHAKNNNICIAMQQAIPTPDVLFFPTDNRAGDKRAHGVVTGIRYPLTATITKKIILINVAEFNRLTATQKKDRISHVLAQFAHEESQWHLFKRENRDRILTWAKRVPFMLVAGALVYYYLNGEPFPYAPTTIDLSQVYDYIKSYVWIAPVPAVSPTWSEAFCSWFAKEQAVTESGLLEKMQVLSGPLMDNMYAGYLDIAQRTPYWLKTMSSALAVSLVGGKIGSMWNSILNTWDSYRADTIVCEKRGQEGFVGVFERVGQDVSAGTGGITRLQYLALQKKLGQI